MSREAILGRVREALGKSTDDHVRDALYKSSSQLPILANGPDGSVQAVKEFLPQVGPTFEDHKIAFQSLSEKLQTQFVCVPDLEGAKNVLRQLVEEFDWSLVGVHEQPLVEAVAGSTGLSLLNTSSKYDTRDLAMCDAGISGCDALIAQTASVLVTSHSAGGRALSVLPPHHVVIATRDQMVTTMADGFEVLRSKYHDCWPTFSSFITGPSRTADIERVLVLGAHGPKKLTVILIESP